MTFATDQQLDTSGLSDKCLRILNMREAVLVEWECRVRRQVRGAAHLSHPIIINTLPAFFDNLAEALAPGYPRAVATSHTDIAGAHGNERARMTSYGPAQLIQEYQIFRDTFSSMAEAAGIVLSGDDWRILHASIDAAVTEAVEQFSAMHEGLRKRMAASLSHDMRVPLSVVTVSAQLLALQPAPDKIDNIARKIAANGSRLEEMIRELLDALSLHQGRRMPLVLSEFDIRPLAQQICDQANDQWPHKCELIGPSLTGYWCENALRRALENLVSNAVKYGDGGPVLIKIESGHERVILTVHNSGNPIPPQHLGRVFDYLWREDERVEGGWGIGLPFVQSVAESHGGSIGVDSSAATGTTFMIDIPRDCRPFVAAAGSC